MKKLQKNNMATRPVTFFLLLYSTLFACNDVSRQATLPSSTGKSGEIVIAMDDISWNSEAGVAIRGCLASEHPALPQSESLFSLIHVPYTGFKGILKNHRNILLVKYPAEENSFTLKHDVYASGQLFAEINIKSDSGIINLFSGNCATIAEQFNRAEKLRIQSGYQQLKDDNIIRQISAKHIFQLTVPRGYELVKNENNFAWLKRELEEGHQGVLIYNFPYIAASEPAADTAVFTAGKIRTIRDSVCKINVPGALAGSYMMTSPVFTPLIKKLNYKNYPALEIRGLWQVYNDFMGGPFVTLILFDNKKHRIVFIEGYVYAPNREKREFLRQVEAIVYSAGFN